MGWGGVYKGCVLKTELWRLVDDHLCGTEGQEGSGIIRRTCLISSSQDFRVAMRCSLLSPVRLFTEWAT